MRDGRQVWGTLRARERAVRDGAARQAGGGSGRALGTPLRSLNRNPEHADA